MKKKLKMKRDKLNEINKIKNLINLLENRDLLINEQSDQEIDNCKKIVKDAGYNIYGSGLEQENIDFLENKCKGNQNLSEVLKVLKDDGISSSNIEVGIEGKNCYVYVKSKTNLNDIPETTFEDTTIPTQELKKYKIPHTSVTFWDDGDLIIATDIPNSVTGNIGKYGDKFKVFVKVLIYGEYSIINGQIKIKEGLISKYVVSFDNGKQKTTPLNTLDKLNKKLNGEQFNPTYFRYDKIIEELNI